MAKEDFCFTYYDGDAARDVAHMTRLCRGAYHDLISMQRKVGHLDMDTIRMVLSSDFDNCWSSLKFILKQDPEGKFYVEWVENSIAEMKKNAAKNKKKIVEYWAGVKAGTIPRNKKTDTTVQPQYENVYTNEIHLEDVNGNEDGNIGKGGTGGKTENDELPCAFLMSQKFLKTNPGYVAMPSKDMPAIIDFANFLALQLEISNECPHFTPEEKNRVLHEWGRFCDWYKLKGGNDDIAYIVKFKLQKTYAEIKNGNTIGTDNRNTEQSTQNRGGKSAGATSLLDMLKTDIQQYGPGSTNG